MRAWRLVIGAGSGQLDSDGARNMAVDDVLFDAAKVGGPATLRFYRWAPACLSLGRNQPARGRYDVDGRVPGVDFVRRPPGGVAVYHDLVLTYRVECPVGALGAPRQTYLRVHTAIARGLASLGVPAVVSAPGESRTLGPADPLGVCFAAPAEGEILAEAGKLVGSAQRTESHTILQHGSILIDGSQDRAAAHAGALGSAPVVGGPGAAEAQSPTLKALLGRVPMDIELIDAITASFEADLGIRLAPASLSADELGRLAEAERRYRSDDWTWRT